MTAIVEDRELEKQLIRQRHKTGANRRDEVWDAVYLKTN